MFRRGAHPRACGENAAGMSPSEYKNGSSPRVRGKPRGGARDPAAPGLIPARAGKTRTRATSPTAPWAHPRACGENSTNHPRPRSSRGSSPRVRGKRLVEFFGRDLARLIPARAGKTKTSPQPGPGGTAHPRACGENRRSCTRRPPEPGSSPRVRGKQRWRFRQCQHSRLIPARAGKMAAAAACSPARSAHPRACGENFSSPNVVVFGDGSSPRVRGKPGPPVRNGSIEGLIPARAGKTGPPARPRGRPAAHPRACGENAMHACARATAAGSSPRVRGKRQAHGTTARGQRLIPARAGKTRCHRGCHLLLRAHPRACGENSTAAVAFGSSAGSSPVSYTQLTLPKTDQVCRSRWAPDNSRPSAPRTDGSGSSPRVRGKLISFSASCGVCGLIPARAGKTLGLTQGQITRRAHPRACGENGRIGVPVSLASGSSPRVRGKRTSTVSPSLTTGLIPARAGKTRSVCAAARRERAHPRACGENVASASEWGGTTGSSPRVRGKPHRAVLHRHDARLIPARAGKTVHEVGRDPGPRAHPRACGENDGGIVGSVLGWGSSPRVRGKREVDEPGRPGGGLIPARAGKTSSPSVGSPEPSAHPRACGENLMRRRAEARASGSSPRVRGKPGWWPRAPRESGLIPARAGKTRASTPWRRTRRAHPRACGENRM